MWGGPQATRRQAVRYPPQPLSRRSAAQFCLACRQGVRPAGRPLLGAATRPCLQIKLGNADKIRGALLVGLHVAEVSIARAPA